MRVCQINTLGRSNAITAQMGQTQKCYEERQSAKDVPAKQISFGGFNFSKGVEKLGTKLGKSARFQRMAERAEDFGPVVEAAIVMGITCLIRPLVVLAMPTTEGKDKETIAVKSIAGGLVGFVFTLSLFPLCLATKRVFENPSKYIRDRKLVEKLSQKVRPDNAKSPTYKDVMKGLYNKGPDILIAKFKSMATIGIMPFLIATLFPSTVKGKKPEDKQKGDKKC